MVLLHVANLTVYFKRIEFYSTADYCYMYILYYL